MKLLILTRFHIFASNGLNNQLVYDIIVVRVYSRSKKKFKILYLIVLFLVSFKYFCKFYFWCHQIDGLPISVHFDQLRKLLLKYFLQTCTDMHINFLRLTLVAKTKIISWNSVAWLTKNEHGCTVVVRNYKNWV